MGEDQQPPSVESRINKMDKTNEKSLWKEVQKKYGFTEEDIRKAKDLNFKPEIILRLDPGPKERWKLPPKQWIGSLYDKKWKKIAKKRRSREKGRFK